jgi:multidrug efflux pump
MRSFTDIFIKHPVLAVVVNLVIVLIGLRALISLPVQQYPQIESSSVVITTLYYGASAETIRGFLTTPIERAVSAIGGVDYVESTSRAGVSTVTVRLKLNHDSTAALAEVTARLQQVRSELPEEAEPPVIEMQRADRPYATFYLSFNSTERSVPAITDYLLRTIQPQLATIPGVQRVTNNEGGRQVAMRVWIDPDRWQRLISRPVTSTAPSSATTISPLLAKPREIRCRLTSWRTPTSARWRNSRTSLSRTATALSFGSVTWRGSN